MESAAKRIRAACIGVVLLMALMVVLACSGYEVWNYNVEHCEDAPAEMVEELKKRLKDPDSLKDVKVNIFKATESNEDRVSAWITYRAKNSYGAYVPNERHFHLDYETCEVSW